MKKTTGLLSILILTALCFSFAGREDDANTIPPTPQRTGDATKGYEYLTTGDFIKSGVPYRYFIMANGKADYDYLNRSGKNATVSYGYNVITHEDVEMVVPTCLQCHARMFDGQLVIGLGNNALNFAHTKSVDVSSQIKMLKTLSPRQYRAAEAFFKSFTVSYPLMETEVRGVNIADKLAAILVAHRDPQTLEWSDTALLKIPEEVIPTDVPAWWLLKKKNAMFYTGFGRGDQATFMMLSNLLTVKDSAEAREVSTHFGDVMAYIRSIEAPRYSKIIVEEKAKRGEVVFNENCSSCHGTYGKNGSYPNRLVPLSVIQTDSMLCTSIETNTPFLDWFRNSWFVQGDNPAFLVPYHGYIAPPLDGVWITGPYLHNGSVPTIEALLNSKLRPVYWQWDFTSASYDYNKLGVQYQVIDTAIAKRVYNTTLPGYSNSGHYFGDALTDEERSDVIEYLKTL